MEAAVHAIGIYNAEPFTPEAKMRGITGFFNNGCLPHYMGYFALAICFGHGVAKPPQERLHCSRKTNPCTQFAFLKNRNYFNYSVQNIVSVSNFKKFIYAKPKRFVKKRVEDSTLLIG